MIFTEHRDTPNYLVERIGTLLPGGGRRHPRRPAARGARKAQGVFTQDSGVSILVATDAAGEGINLQSAPI